MKKIIPILVLGVLTLSGLGSVAMNSNLKELNFETINYENIDGGSRDYTHTVLVEVGTRTTCPACPASNLAWHNIYGGGNYDFEYTELVYDMNPVAYARFQEFNPAWVPTSYWDGGEYVYPGTSVSTFQNYLDLSGARIVPDLVADLDVVWLDHTQMDISLNITNNEDVNYPGHLRVYIIELESTLWNDYNGNPYYHAFLDFAINEPINIPFGSTYTDHTVWDKVTAGYPNILVNNVQVILTVFDDEPHESFSDPPGGNPFLAYYADETVAVIPEFENNPPDIPHIDGETNGKVGVEYSYSLCCADPDGDDMYYVIDWGDNSGEEIIGPLPSGVCTEATHTWSNKGTYIIKCKARDVYGAEGPEVTLEVSMPKNKIFNFNFNLMSWLFERFPNAFPILRHMLGL